MKLSSSTLSAVAFAILSASGLRAAPHHQSGHQQVGVAKVASSSSSSVAATSTNAVLDTATECAAPSTVTVHDVQTVFVTLGGDKAVATSVGTKATTTKAATTTTTTKAGTKATTTKAATTTTTTKAGTKATTTKAATTTTTKAGTKATTTNAGKSTTTTTLTVTVPRATITSAPANNNGGKTTNNNKGNSNNNKGGNKGKGGKIVTVTRTVKHVKPITKVVTKTQNNQVVVTSTAVTTVTSTEIQTVTAEASPTTIISTTTLDNPITVTATVTEQGQEVVKTTEVLTQVVTVTSDVVQETQATTVTDAGTQTSVTESAAATTTDSVVDIQSLSSTAATASETATATTSAADSGATEDPQTSLTLDPRSIMTSQASDGNPSDGQVASLTSTNNFMNFCLTQNVPITNGQQIKTGSCNPVPMGRILATDRLPSSVFVFPTNFGTIAANTAFTIKMKIKNLKTGNFVNANNNYYSAPAQVDGTGTLVGHSHCVIEPLDSFDQTKPTNPGTFSFFKGLNGVADQDGILTADVTGGLPAGKYRIGSINAAANHQPALASVAQHGTMDAWAYFTVA